MTAGVDDDVWDDFGLVHASAMPAAAGSVNAARGPSSLQAAYCQAGLSDTCATAWLTIGLAGWPLT